MATPRSTNDLIGKAGEDLRRIQDAAEFWQRMESVKFSDRYHEALLAAGVPAGKADEIAAMVRQYIERIAGGLETATYLLKELAAEVGEARRLTRGLPTNGFQV